MESPGLYGRISSVTCFMHSSVCVNPCLLVHTAPAPTYLSSRQTRGCPECTLGMDICRLCPASLAPSQGSGLGRLSHRWPAAQGTPSHTSTLSFSKHLPTLRKHCLIPATQHGPRTPAPPLLGLYPRINCQTNLMYGYSCYKKI